MSLLSSYKESVPITMLMFIMIRSQEPTGFLIKLRAPTTKKILENNYKTPDMDFSISPPTHYYFCP